MKPKLESKLNEAVYPTDRGVHITGSVGAQSQVSICSWWLPQYEQCVVRARVWLLYNVLSSDPIID